MYTAPILGEGGPRRARSPRRPSQQANKMTRPRPFSGSTPPPCRALGNQCRELAVTLRIAELDEDDGTFHDAAGTWLMGHSERIAFGELYVQGSRLLVDAQLDVPCRHLTHEAQG